MPDFAAPRAAFRSLHETGCFVIPNPWDVGTARYLARAGFAALATTSAGFAFSRGLPDAVDSLSRHEVVAHVGEIVRATELPVNADYQNGYAELDGLQDSVRMCCEAGVAGLSIEDATGNPNQPLYDIGEAVERIRAAKEVTQQTGVLLTARAECFLVGHPDPLAESIKRLRAYSEAGADVLYAPGLKTREDIAAIVEAADGKPVNVIMSSNLGLTVADLAEMGVRRISVGSALARAAWGGLMRAVGPMLEGSFAGLEGIAGLGEINRLMT